MKIAVAGKGGVGKTTLVVFLARAFVERGRKVFAIDCDSNPNLAAASGVPDAQSITPIAQMADLIEERTGAKPGRLGQFFKMNPTVEDLPEKLSISANGVRVMVLGGVRAAGGGCVCPENVLLKNLVSHLILSRDETVILDMEAGLEHLGRGSAMGVDCMLVVTEPSPRSMETARRIQKLAGDLGIKKILGVANKLRGELDRKMVDSYSGDLEMLAYLPFSEEVLAFDRGKENSVRGTIFHREIEKLATILES